MNKIAIGITEISNNVIYIFIDSTKLMTGRVISEVACLIFISDTSDRIL